MPAASILRESAGDLVDQPAASSGCGRGPGIRPGTTSLLTVAVPPARAAGTSRRSFWLHVPRRYTPDHMTPLMLAFHGGGGTGLGMERASDLSATADRYGFLVAYPQGLRQDHGRAPPGWDASGPEDPDANGIDDGLYVSDVLNALQAGYCVDPARIWATGFSNGGSMAGYLACVLAARIASFAPVEGVFFQIPGGCHPAHPAAILAVHVRTDPVAPYAGVPARGSPDYFAPAIPIWLQEWADRDGCSPRSQQIAASRDIAAMLWAHCPAGTSVLGDTLRSGGHSWFGAIGAAAGNSLLLAFFAAHPLRPAPPSWAPGNDEPLARLSASGIAIRSIRIFRLPEPNAQPFDITAGPNGSIWFTEFAADEIGRISPAGTLTQFKVPTPAAGPYQIAAAAGAIWFTEYNTTKIGRVSLSGRVTEFQIPRPTYGGAGIAGSQAGPVFVADPAGFIDVISASGGITRTRVPTSFGLPFGIARLESGALWLNELTGYYEFSSHLLGFSSGSGARPQGIALPDPFSDVVALAAGPQGSMWFADFGAGDVGQVRRDGRISLYGVGFRYGGLSDITAGPDGAMWLSEQGGVVARITADGNVAQLALPSVGSNPDGIAAGPGKSIWVTETGSDAIAEITLP